MTVKRSFRLENKLEVLPYSDIVLVSSDTEKFIFNMLKSFKNKEGSYKSLKLKGISTVSG